MLLPLLCEVTLATLPCKAAPLELDSPPAYKKFINKKDGGVLRSGRRKSRSGTVPLTYILCVPGL